MNEIESAIFRYRILYQYLQLDVWGSDSDNISEMEKSLKKLHDQFEAIIKLIKENSIEHKGH